MPSTSQSICIQDILTCLDMHAIAYTYDGDMGVCVTGTSELHTAHMGDVAWFESKDYINSASITKASVVITTGILKVHVADRVAVVVTENPRLAYAKIKTVLYPLVQANGCIAKTAVVASDAVIGKGVQIDDFAIVKSGAVVQSGTIIGAYTVIGENVQIAENSHIGTHCHIEHTTIGQNCILHAHVTIGTDGFGFVLDFKQGHHSIAHTGGVRIGNDVHIGAGVCIDKGVESYTTIGDGTRIDNLVHIAHNVTIGKNCVIPGQVGIAGSATIGDGVMFSGQAGVIERVHVDDGAIVLMRAVVVKDIGKNQVVSGVPARTHKENLKREAQLNQLLKKTIRSKK